MLATMALAGCANSNPVQAESNVVQQGLSAGAQASLEGALTTAQAAVAGYRATNGADPSSAQFAALPDVVQAQRGVTLSYRPTTTGGCLTATTTSGPTTSRYATDTVVLPAGQSC
jgi:hypothetical protein